MAKVERPLQEPPSDSQNKESLDQYLEDLRRKANSIGDAVADVAIVTTETAGAAYTANEQTMLNNLKTDVTTLKTQLNALMDELRDAGFLARS